MRAISYENRTFVIIFIIIMYWLAGRLAFSQESEQSKPAQKLTENTPVTASDYKVHMRLHQARVKVLGEFLIGHYREEFPHVEPSILSEFLSLHDQAKTDDSLNPENPLSQRLASLFSKSVFHEDDRDKVKTVIKDLNEQDQILSNQFFQNRLFGLEYLKQFDNSYIQGTVVFQYKRIENIADLVDRGFDPVAHLELGKTLKAGSEFLQELRDQHMARYLEYHYHELTGKLESEGKGTIWYGVVEPLLRPIKSCSKLLLY